MRTLPTLALAAGLLAPALSAGQDKKDPAKKPEPTLNLGDPAPPLKVSKWLQGPEVKAFEKGHVYVVEFWATWCVPCIAMMPHMSDLQQQYRGKATFVGFTARDKANTPEKVAQFVEKRGPKLKYAFAYADDRDTYDAWMTASGQGGIPCCFVVDKDTRLAYIGHPMYLDLVLPKVVAGSWSKNDAAAVEKVEKDVTAVFESFEGDPEAALKAVADFQKKYPELAGIPYFTEPKLGALLKAKKTGEARKFAEEAIAKAGKADDTGALMALSRALRSREAAGDKELAALAVKAAEANLKVVGDKDPVALYFVAEAHFAAGDKAKARDFGAKAVAAAPDERTKTQLETLTKKYQD